MLQFWPEGHKEPLNVVGYLHLTESFESKCRGSFETQSHIPDRAFFTELLTTESRWLFSQKSSILNAWLNSEYTYEIEPLNLLNQYPSCFLQPQSTRGLYLSQNFTHVIIYTSTVLKYFEELERNLKHILPLPCPHTLLHLRYYIYSFKNQEFNLKLNTGETNQVTDVNIVEHNCVLTSCIKPIIWKRHDINYQVIVLKI